MLPTGRADRSLRGPRARDMSAAKHGDFDQIERAARRRSLLQGKQALFSDAVGALIKPTTRPVFGVSTLMSSIAIIPP